MVGSIEVLQDGLVGRGVLLDIPRLRGVSWLEPGEQIFADELEAAEQDQGVTVGQGDILLVRTGHARRLAEFGPWETAGAKAGLHPTAMPFVAERRVAALGSDGNSDTAPSTTDGVAFPIHVLAINAMGVHLLDYLQLEDLRRVCEASGRWEFLFLSAPLRIVGGTGSPVNRSRSCSRKAPPRAGPVPAELAFILRCLIRPPPGRKLRAGRFGGSEEGDGKEA
jgi:kynurenine formamidase